MRSQVARGVSVLVGVVLLLVPVSQAASESLAASEMDAIDEIRSILKDSPPADLTPALENQILQTLEAIEDGSYPAAGQRARLSGAGVSALSFAPLSQLSQPQAAAQSAPSRTYTYDELGRLDTVTSADGKRVKYAYDDAGNRRMVLVPEPKGWMLLLAGVATLISIHRGRKSTARRGVVTKRPEWRRWLLSVALVGATMPGSVNASDGPSIGSILGTISQNGGSSASAATAPAEPQYVLPSLYPDCSGGQCSPGRVGGKLEAELEAVRSALGGDPAAVYQWVYENIEYEWTWGSNKGAEGTLLDRSGNDFDQANLVLALLEGYGHTAVIEYGTIRYDAAAITSWLGIPDDAVLLRRIFGTFGGRDPGSNTVVANGDDTIQYADLERVWVRVDVGPSHQGGYSFAMLDPAFKSHDVIPPIDLGAAMNYDRSVFRTSAFTGGGAQIGSSSVTSPNRDAIHGNLAQYATNLIEHVGGASSGVDLVDVIGGSELVAGPGPILDSVLPGLQQVSAVWTAVPDDLRTTLELAFSVTGASSPPPGACGGFVYTDEIAGRRLTLSPDVAVGGGADVVLRYEGEEIARYSDCLATVSGQVSSSYRYVVAIDHPFADEFLADARLTTNLQTSGTYALIALLGRIGEGRVEYHSARSRINADRFDSLLDEPVIGEAMSVLASGFGMQSSRVLDLLRPASEAHCLFHHVVGFVGQREYPFLDLPDAVHACVSPYSTDGELDTVVDTIVAGHFGGLEASVVHQYQQQDAVSTQYVFDELADSTFYEATKDNFSSIRPMLNGYSTFWLNEFQAFLNSTVNGRWVLPEKGDNTIGTWFGFGVFGMSKFRYQALVSGGLNGGVGTQHGIYEIQPPYFEVPSSHAQSLDPIDLVKGDFLFEHTDLTVGGESPPFGLSLRRSYNSGAFLSNDGMGAGWTHSLIGNVTVGSNALLALNGRSVAEIAAVIAELYVTVDLLRDSDDLANVVIASLSHVWLMEYLRDSVASVRIGSDSSEFFRLTDGSYKAPPGSAAVLTQQPGGQFVLTQKDGSSATFQSDGHIEEWSDRHDNKVTYFYFGDLLSRVEDDFGHSISFHYDGELLDFAMSGGRKVDYGYDGEGRLNSVVDPENHETVLSYTDDGLLEKIFTPGDLINPAVLNVYAFREDGWGYDDFGKVTSQQNAVGEWYDYEYAGSFTIEADPLGHAKKWFFDGNGRTIVEHDQLGLPTQMVYDGEQRLIERISPEGDYVSFTYDDLHNVLSRTRHPKPGFVVDPIEEIYTYEPLFSQIETYTDPMGEVTTYYYDSAGDLDRIERPPVEAGVATTRFIFNSLGLVGEVEDPEGMVTKFGYDMSTGELISRIEDFGGLGIESEWDHYPTGDVWWSEDPLGRRTTYFYDDMRRVEKEVAPGSSAYETEYKYDSEGLLEYVRRETLAPAAPWQVNSWTYTGSGKVETAVDPELSMTTSEYDELDRLWKVEDAEGYVTERSYDARGSLWKVIGPSGQTMAEYTYTLNGLVETMTDPNGNVTEFRYDGFDRLKKTIYPDDSYEELGYNDRSDVVSRRTRAGVTIDYVPDALGQIVQKKVPGEPLVEYKYDLAGRRTAVIDDWGRVDYDFDDLGRLEGVRRSDGLDITYTYYDDGQPEVFTYPDGSSFCHMYDDLGRLDGIHTDCVGGPYIADFGWDALSRFGGMFHENGVGTGVVYELDNDVEAWTNAFPGNYVIYEYGYDRLHNRTSTMVDDPSFEFDLFSVQQRLFVPDELNQYDAVNGDAFMHDLDGNLTSGAGRDFEFDAEGRLIRAGTSTYDYDSDGLRRSKTVDGVTTHYLYDRGHVIGEYDDAGTMIRQYLFGPGTDMPVRMTAADGSNYYYQLDAHGSVVALTNSSGWIVERYTYGPFGETLSASVLGSPFRYAGREWDPETGLYYNRARYYDPEMGRFIQPDPLKHADGLNLYVYGRNNPVRFADPLGLFAKGSFGPAQQSGLGGDFGEGIVSLPRGLGRFARQEARRLGFLGTGQQVQSTLIEDRLLGEIAAVGMNLINEFPGPASEMARDGVRDNAGRIAGRFTASQIARSGMSRAVGRVQAGALGLGLTELAVAGDAQLAVENLALRNQVFVTTVDLSQPILPQISVDGLDALTEVLNAISTGQAQ